MPPNCNTGNPSSTRRWSEVRVIHPDELWSVWRWYNSPMKVLISKYELRAIEERWPDFEQCPDYVEVGSMFAPLASMSLDQRTRLKNAIETVVGKSKLKKGTKPKSARLKQN